MTVTPEDMDVDTIAPSKWMTTEDPWLNMTIIKQNQYSEKAKAYRRDRLEVTFCECKACRLLTCGTSCLNYYSAFICTKHTCSLGGCGCGNDLVSKGTFCTVAITKHEMLDYKAVATVEIKRFEHLFGPNPILLTIQQ